MRFCSACGAPVELRVPAGDNLPRHVCAACSTIHYQNPKIVAGCIPEWQGRILLCRRAIEPRRGLWTVPAGFMENGESTVAAASREAREEANAELDDLVLYGIYHLTQIDQVYVMFRGRLRDGRASAGAESLEVRLFAPGEIPWPDLAFSVVEETLRRYLEERVSGRFGVHVGDIIRDSAGRVRIQRHRQ